MSDLEGCGRKADSVCTEPGVQDCTFSSLDRWWPGVGLPQEAAVAAAEKRLVEVHREVSPPQLSGVWLTYVLQQLEALPLDPTSGDLDFLVLVVCLCHSPHFHLEWADLLH